MFIVSVGEAFPETCISNELLIELQPKLANSESLKQSGIKERRSVLPLEYIRSGIYSSTEAYRVMVESPTELAVRAAKIAIERAGIDVQQIGLVIGDCPTPTQVTPSEGQRVASKLDLKVPAFDISGAQGGFIIHVLTLASWKEEKIPDYVLCISTNTPTGSINYNDSSAGVLFGDGAAAYILSVKNHGKFLIQDGSFDMNCGQSRNAYIEHYESLKIPENYLASYVREGFVEKIKSLTLDTQNIRRFFIGPQCDIPFVDLTAREHGFDNQNILFTGDKFGEVLGASVPTTISKNWDLFKKDDDLYCIQAGIGLKGGAVKLKVVR